MCGWKRGAVESVPLRMRSLHGTLKHQRFHLFTDLQQHTDSMWKQAFHGFFEYFWMRLNKYIRFLFHATCAFAILT